MPYYSIPPAAGPLGIQKGLTPPVPARCADGLHRQPLVSSIPTESRYPCEPACWAWPCRLCLPGAKIGCWRLRRAFYAQIRMWVNADNPAQSDALVFFANVSPAIPPGPQGCAVASPAGGSAVQLDPKACSGGGDGADISTVVVQRLAGIWNMTGGA